MKKYTVPCSWEMFGTLEIEAESLEEAKRIAIEECGLPDEKNFVDDTFYVDDDLLIFYNSKVE